MQPAGNHGVWTSRFAFLMAAVGSAVGLGNIWKFPYTAGVGGGGAFVLIYLLTIACVAIPVIMSELIIGRRGRQSPVNSVLRLSEQAGASVNWRIIGLMGVTAAFLVLSFYSVIAGWAVAYVFKVASGAFSGADGGMVGRIFGRQLANPAVMMAWHASFMAVTVFIVARGVQRGIERAVKILMPTLFVMLVVLVGYSAVAGDLAEAMRFLFAADFGRLEPRVVLSAVGQAFFSVGLAAAVLITYGAYLPATVHIPRAAAFIGVADTLVALLAGLAIFPLVFANGLDPAEGPGLIFVTLPIAFGNMPAGTVFGTIFFILLVFAALTSSISMLEPLVAWGIDHGYKRGFVAIAGGLGAWVIGLGTVFSFNIWAEIRPLAFLDVFADKTIFDLLDYLTANLLMPLGGVLIAIFVGYVLSRQDTRDELHLPDGRTYRVWRFLVRYVAPTAVGAVLLGSLRG